jgi:DNA/RNA endonuclease YhcR with UshA esterase domain
MVKKYGVQILFTITVFFACQLMTSISQAQEKYITPGDAGNHVGEMVTVCGEVGRIENEKLQPIFIKLYQQLNTRNFTIVIYPSDRPKFDNPPVHSYFGKNICVKGMIKTYHNEPEIILHDPSQITIVPSQ